MKIQCMAVLMLCHFTSAFGQLDEYKPRTIAEETIKKAIKKYRIKKILWVFTNGKKYRSTAKIYYDKQGRTILSYLDGVIDERKIYGSDSTIITMHYTKWGSLSRIDTTKEKPAVVKSGLQLKDEMAYYYNKAGNILFICDTAPKTKPTQKFDLLFGGGHMDSIAFVYNKGGLLIKQTYVYVSAYTQSNNHKTKAAYYYYNAQGLLIRFTEGSITVRIRYFYL